MHSYSFGNEFHLLVNENCYSDERTSARLTLGKGLKVTQKYQKRSVNQK